MRDLTLCLLRGLLKLSSGLPFVAGIKLFEQKQLGEGKVCFSLHFQVTTEGKELKGRNLVAGMEACTTEQLCSLALLPLAHAHVWPPRWWQSLHLAFFPGLSWLYQADKDSWDQKYG